MTFNGHFTFSLEAASWIDSEAAELVRRVYLPFCGDTAPPPALSSSSATEPRRPAPCSRARAQAHIHMLIWRLRVQVCMQGRIASRTCGHGVAARGPAHRP